MREIPIVIPAYEPDDRLIDLLDQINTNKIGIVILVDDGSGEKFRKIFEEAEKRIKATGGCLLKHSVNMGKGKALKTAFSYIIENYPAAVGAVTADSDGQHTVECIQKVSENLMNYPNNLILGVRTFDGEDIPWKSRFGNKLTEKIFSYVAGIHVSDTQTGLRGIPMQFMKELIHMEGDRFEFEMRMLLECAGRYNVTEVPIQTIYDSKENHQTHFNPVSDSLKIYRILGGKFVKYIISSFSASIIDLLMFSIFCFGLKNRYPEMYVALATMSARAISATYNYIINYKIVFKSRESVGMSGMKYIILAIAQMCISALLVTLFVKFVPIVPEVIEKVIVDTGLFFLSYYIQQKYVFS